MFIVEECDQSKEQRGSDVKQQIGDYITRHVNRENKKELDSDFKYFVL